MNNVPLATEPLAHRQRGCKCKKSNCLKLYCECFAAGGRCTESCQCISCKNQTSNQLLIDEALQAIEKRKQKSLRSSVRVDRSLELDRVVELTSCSVVRSKTPATFSTTQKAAATIGGDSPERTKGCSCKKSNCLKLYCECLAAQRICDHRCSCKGCRNRHETLAEREWAVARILERNPMAFQPKIATGSSQHVRGCNCRKSGCTKNYCECHQAGVACTARCACQKCRNTESCALAKKMLGLAGANTDEDSPRVRSDPASQRTLVKQLHRVDMTNADWHDGLQTPPHVFTKKPTALESLSRTAPVGSSTPMQRRKFAVYDGPSTVPTKRPSSDMDRYHAIDESIVAPACAKRRCARRNSHKLSVVEHVQEMVAPMEDRLPNAVDTVANVYDARNTRGVGDPELTILGRSLLYAAMAVECADEENNGAASFASHRPVEEQVGDVEAEPQRADDISDNREALSPTAAGLFCEEEYAEATDEDDDAAKRVSNGCSTASSTTSADHESISSGGQIGGKHSRSAMQERAVLQEFSVWLRNVAADARSCE